MPMKANPVTIRMLGRYWFTLPEDTAFCDLADADALFCSILEGTAAGSSVSPSAPLPLGLILTLAQVDGYELTVSQGSKELLGCWLLCTVMRDYLINTPEETFPDGTQDKRSALLRMLKDCTGGFEENTLLTRPRIRCDDRAVNSVLYQLYNTSSFPETIQDPKAQQIQQVFSEMEVNIASLPSEQALELITVFVLSCQLYLLRTENPLYAQQMSGMITPKLAPAPTAAEPLDTLRKKLLAALPSQEHGQLEEQLTKMAALLSPIGRESEHFLSDLISARYASTYVSISGVNDWLQSPESETCFAKPMAFAEQLVLFAERYTQFIHCTQSENELQPYPGLTYIGCAGTRIYRNHLLVLLACTNSLIGHNGYFSQLLRQLEGVIFSEALAHVPVHANVQRWARWAVAARSVHNPNQLKQFLTEHLVPVQQQHAETFKQAFMQMDIANTDPVRQLYVLSRLENRLRQQKRLAPVSIDKYRLLKNITIMPMQPINIPFEYESPMDYQRTARMLSNQTLVEGNLPLPSTDESFPIKKAALLQSKVLLNTQLLAPLESFTAGDALKRQEMMYTVARGIWSVDE